MYSIINPMRVNVKSSRNLRNRECPLNSPGVRLGSLDHDLIISALAEHIQDGRFLTLVRKLLDAGYMDNWTFNKTFSGVPQGSILSPVLSNILLSTLDRFVATELMPQYNTGRKKKANQAYQTLIRRAHQRRKNGQMEAAQQLKQQAQKLPSIDPQDPDYRRLRYCRYADDFALALYVRYH